MNTPFFYELIGYIASGLVAISLMMRSVLRLRIINLLGAIFFTIYGLLIKAYPVAAVNGFIILINLYYLAEMYRSKASYTLIDAKRDSDYVYAFLDFYKADIARFAPNFNFKPNDQHIAWMIVRDMVPVGLFVAERDRPDRLLVELDYVIPGYRDLKPGAFLYAQRERFAQLGVKRVCSQSSNPDQQRYLQRMGFSPAQNEPNVVCRAVE